MDGRIRRGAVSLVLLLVAAAGFATFFWWKAPSARVTALQALSTHPKIISPGFRDRLNLELDGKDWWKSRPVVVAGANVEFRSRLEDASRKKEVRGLFICPRPVDSPDFSYRDVRVDHYVGTNDEASQLKFKLKPGDYVVRFYIRAISFDAQNETLPSVSFVAELPLIIAAPSDYKGELLIPGDVPKYRQKMREVNQGTDQ